MNKFLKFLLGMFAFPFVMLIWLFIILFEFYRDNIIKPCIELSDHMIEKINEYARRK